MRLIIYTSPTRSGKTTMLQSFIKKHLCTGILTPDIDGHRFFLNIESGDKFMMEDLGSEEVLKVGRFHFSKEAFRKAGEIMLNISPDRKIVILDEAGPLELRGEGFAGVLKTLLSSLPDDYMLILVVREGLVQQVTDHFNLHPEIVNDLSLLMRCA